MYSAISQNKRKTVLIMAIFIGMISGIGYLISLYFGNTRMFPFIVAGAAIYTLLQYFIAGKMAMMMTGAQEIQQSDNPRLWRIVENLAITTGTPMPKVYIINDPAPNAFATGKDPKRAMVGATTGLLDLMNDRELTAVMAHEIGHVRNYDIRVNLISFGLVSTVGFLADMVMHGMFSSSDNNRNGGPIALILGLIVVILAPFIAQAINSAISRQREYLADATGALTTRDSEGMAMALEKLQGYSRPMQKQVSGAANMFLVNPLDATFISKMFSSHPPLEDRIKRIRANADKF